MSAPVTYASDHNKEYALGLRQCETLGRLKEFLEHWAPFAPDAYKAGIQMDAVDFVDFRQGLIKESQSKYAGDRWAERYGNIVLPDLLLHVSVVAQQFNAPWGVAFIRLQQEGYIIEQDGIYFFKEPTDGEES